MFLTFIEWIQFPIAYMQNGTFAEQTRALTDDVYSQVSGMDGDERLLGSIHALLEKKRNSPESGPKYIATASPQRFPHLVAVKRMTPFMP